MLQVKRLVAEGISLNQADSYGYLPLHHAVLSGDLNTVLMCLPRSSPIGEMTEVTVHARDSLTALHIAAKDRNPQIAHAIISYSNWMVRQPCAQPLSATINVDCICAVVKCTTKPGTLHLRLIDISTCI